MESYASLGSYSARLRERRAAKFDERITKKSLAVFFFFVFLKHRKMQNVRDSCDAVRESRRQVISST